MNTKIIETSLRMKNDNFAGKVAIITGGTSGIGLKTAITLLQSGASVALIGRQEEKGQAVMQQLASYESKVCFIQGDISKTQDC